MKREFFTAMLLFLLMGISTAQQNPFTPSTHLPKGIQTVPLVFHSFNALQKLDSLILQSSDGVGNWLNDIKEVYTYNADGTTATTQVYQWNGSQNLWEVANQETFSYDSNMRLSEVIYAYWDDTTNTLIEAFKQTYTYNVNGLLETVLGAAWDDATSSWQDVTQDIYFYDSSNRLEKIISAYMSNTGWVDSEKTDYIYDTNGLLVEIVTAFPDGLGGWLNSEKQEYIYSAGTLSEVIYDEWDFISSSWVMSEKDVFFYDTQGNFSSIEHYEYDDQTNSWGLVSRQVTTYDNTYTLSDLLIPYSYSSDPNFISYFTHMLLNLSFQEWINNTWEEAAQAHFYYSEFTSVSTSDIDQKPIDAFPNPATSEIRFELPQEITTADFQIFDLQGRQTLNGTVHQGEKVLIAHLPAGTYFYRLQADRKILYGKFTKQ